MPVDRNGLEVLDRSECLRLLASGAVGRVGAWGRSGPELHGALGTEPVAFEVDDVDVAYEWGWSVLVRGRARHLEDPSEVARAERRLLRSWGPGDHRRFSAIPTTEVSGRRIGLHGTEPQR